MISKIKLIPIVLLSFTGVSATVVGVNQYINNIQQEENVAKNPVLTLDANDSEARFSSGDRVISKIVKYGLSWANYSKNMPIPTKPGFDIMGWQYSYNGVDYDDVYDDLIFDQNTYLRVKAWGAATKDHFATDSWATIVSIAQNGLAALKEAYFSDISPYGNTFVIQDYTNAAEVAAKTRTVYLKGIGEYKVHVIGEDTDEIAGKYNKVAALTFEFDDIVVPSIGYSMGGDDNSWSNSYVRSFLQNSFIQRLPEPINDDQVLQTVAKKTYNQTSGEVEESEDTIFIPSLSELGYVYMNENVLIPEPGIEKASSNTDCLVEGGAYSFYLSGKNNSARAKKYNDNGTMVNSTYWTRSPFTTDINDIYNDDATLHKGVHIVDENGLTPGMYEHEEGVQRIRANKSANGISPCFCIGQDVVHRLVVQTSTGSDIISQGTSYIKNNLDTQIQLYDRRDYSAPVIYYNYELVDGVPYYTGGYQEISVKMGETEIPAVEGADPDPIFTNYTYDRKTGLLNINLDENRHPITDDIYVTLTQPESNEPTFENDPWEGESGFLDAANQGYNVLVKKYERDYYGNGQTFLGLKRIVTLQNEDLETELPVRVVGENHDQISSTGKIAPLTFQMTKGYQLDVDMDKEYSSRIANKTANTYSASEFHSPISYLDDYSGPHYWLNKSDWAGEPPSTYFKDLKFDDVQEVKKEVTTISNTVSSIQSFDAHFFLPSIEELIGENTLGFDGEGTQYEYYQNVDDDYVYRLCTSSLSSIDRYYNGAYYLTRSLTSSSIADREYNTIAVSGQLGKIRKFPAYCPDSQKDVASFLPCFAIGANE